MARFSVTTPPRDVAAAVSARLELVDALEAIATGSRDADSLESAVSSYKAVTGPPNEDDPVNTFVNILDALIHGVRWAFAARQADDSAERHATACRLRATDVLEQFDDGWPSGLRAAALHLAELADHTAPSRAALLLSSVPLPPRITNLFRAPDPEQAFLGGDSAPVDIPAVSLLIRYRGEPIMRPSILQPGALNHLYIEARVDEWPDGAEAMEVSFIGIYDLSFLSASAVRFTPDAMGQPLEVHIAGERPAGDPPLELTARVEFLRGGERVQARVVGNTTLQVVTFDLGTATPLNIPTAARRILQMMGEMNNALPNLSAANRSDVRILLEGVLTFGHTVLDDRLGQQEEFSESWFQTQLKSFLQANPQIGARLGEKVGRAGGVTDLVLGNVVLELKVEKTSGITLNDACDRYVEQPTQYASAGDSQVSLLVILDVSPKRAPAGVMGNEVGWAYPKLASGPNPPFPSLVGVVVIRAGFPVPSAFSR